MPFVNLIIVFINNNYENDDKHCHSFFDHSVVSTEEIASELRASTDGDIIIVYPDGYRVPWFTNIIKDILKPTRFDNDNILSLECGYQELSPKVGYLLEKKYCPNKFDSKTSIIFIAYHNKRDCQKIPQTPDLDRYNWQNVERYDKKGLTWLKYTRLSQRPP